MTEETKINFHKPMLVLKIRDTYKAPYHKNKFITLKKSKINTKKKFAKFLEDYTSVWSSGTYEIQYLFSKNIYTNSEIFSTFARFDVRDGKVVKLYDCSPYTKKDYPCWQHIKKVVRRSKRKTSTKPKRKTRSTTKKKTSSKKSKKTIKK